MWQQFDVNVMVSGNRCKQYNNQGKTYIEAKDGSEWYFQIQNNTPSRVLAVCSVDGLNVLTGEKAKPDDTGYIIDSYHSQKIKGFRFSDSEWALFKFGYKLNGKTYAQSKGDGSERNCGVIGVKLFYEKPKVVKYEPQSYQHSYTCSGSYSMGISGAYHGNVNWSPGPDLHAYHGLPESNAYYLDYKYTSNATTPAPFINKFTKLAGVKKRGIIAADAPKAPNFDMGTEWGKRETSKVQTIDFERGCEAYTTDIFYASRNSLIEMGIPLGNELKVRFPESFPNRYATPPKHWNG